ncbi:MAG: hypothetical protein ACTSR2_03750, partial [Candidatus Hodarchaeales archaeon]
SCLFIILISSGLSYLLFLSIRKLESSRNLWKNLITRTNSIPEGIFIVILLLLIGLSVVTPRLMYNTIDFNYEGSQEIIDQYLELEIAEYFVGIDALENDSCSGFNSFRIAPNYLGSTERSMLHEIILTSKYKAKTSITYIATEYSQLSKETILTAAGYLFYYEYGYWNNTFHHIEDNLAVQFPNLSWVADSIYLVKETGRMDNTVGSDMLFSQLIVFLPELSIIVILSGHQVACYD